jgi:AAA family ATP:ADP antiporter
MTRFGIGVALMVMPVAAMAGSLGFMVLPVLVLGSFLNTADGGFQYSINQSAREVLYTPTSKAEKYQAKAFIDMFVVRFAKAVAVGLSLAITLVFAGFDSVRWLSLLTLVFLAIWILVVVFVGREFSRQTAQLEEPQAAAGVVSGSPVPDTEFV